MAKTVKRATVVFDAEDIETVDGLFHNVIREMALLQAKKDFPDAKEIKCEDPRMTDALVQLSDGSERMMIIGIEVDVEVDLTKEQEHEEPDCYDCGGTDC